MQPPQSHAAVRELLLKHLEKDIIGPSFQPGTTDYNKSEILNLEGSTPLRYFLTGFLVPKSNTEESHNPDSGADEFNDINSEKVDHKTGFLQTSSMGCTVRPSKSCKKISVNVEWGIYNKMGDNQWKRTNHKKTNEIFLSEILFLKSAKLIATPFLPYRPPRPMRCRYTSVSFGIS